MRLRNMYEKVKKAQKTVDYIMYSYILVSVLLILSSFILYGIAEGVYRLITLGIGTITAIALLSYIKEGSIGARIVQGGLSLIGALLGVLAIFSELLRLNVVGIIIMSLMSIYFLACGIFLLFSPHVNQINKYYKLLNGVKWLWSWKGKSIGYCHEGYLWNPEGVAIGKFVEDEIFLPEGEYLGELYRNNGRLCFDKSKADKSTEKFNNPESYYKFDKKEDTSAMVLYGNYEEFRYE